MFPKYNDWDIAYTPSGLLKRRTQQALRYAALAVFVACVVIAKVSGIGLVGLVTRILSSLLIFVESGATFCRERLGQHVQN